MTWNPKTPNEIKSFFQVRKHVYHDADNLDTAFDAGGELFSFLDKVTERDF